MPALLPLPVRSELPLLARELHHYRCESSDNGKVCDVDELNPARARMAAWLELGGDALKISVTPIGRAS